ncbi:hypothetical protein NP233_g10921 [Leucocoprinus birnbaumii]|uniref:DUF6534 domain-containing protein n=1 Tax=Leucocoprinus birnbaumii TaxID=56174 RepID=A0AAD5VHD3_9AGAR|nr:hypothetical protein NP233_g10921 [Leucocoprinus birnbaumii]
MTGPEITLANTFGALEIGTMVAVCLFGIVTVQTEYYFREFREDRLWLKATVAFVWILEIGHTVGICMEVYRATILFNGRPLEYNNFKAIGVATFLSGLITMIAQSFFSFRAWRLLPNPYRFIGLVCIVASVVRLGFSTWLSEVAITAPSLAAYVTGGRWLITMLLSMGTALDVVVAFSMMYFFLTKRKNALQTTTRMVDRLVGFTIRTGFLTSLTAVGVLVAFRLTSDTYIWVGIYVCLAKMYSNAFLSALNGRHELRKTMGTSGLVVENSTSNLDRLTRRKPSISVVVDIQTERDIELQDNPHNWERSATTPSSSSLDKKSGTPFP